MNKLMLTTQEIMNLTHCSRAKVEKAGREAKAEVVVGTYRRWNWDRLVEYYGGTSMESREIMLSTQELMQVLGCGRRNAEKIGKLANAQFVCGSYKRWSMDKIRQFVYREAN